VPPVEQVRDCVPVGQIRLGYDHRREEDDVRKCDGHAATSERMAHVPCIAEEDNALPVVRPALFYGREERVGHAPETVFGKRAVNGCVERFGELRDDVGEDIVLEERIEFELKAYFAPSAPPPP
jgi:hypothetical protein